MCDCDITSIVLDMTETGPKSINGPEGSVSAATIDSLHLLGFGLTQLKTNTEKRGYRNIDMLRYDIISRKLISSDE